MSDNQEVGRNLTNLLEEDEILLTAREASELTGISESALSQGRQVGRRDYPPYIKVGKNVRYRLKTVKQWLKSLEEQH